MPTTDETYPRPITLLEDVRSTYNVVAAVRDAEAARGAIEVLEHGGIEGADIALLGSITRRDDHAPPRRGVRRVVRLFLLGLTLGAIGGAAVGWMSDIGGDAATWLWAVFGALLGGMLVAVSSFGVSRAWWRTFEAEDAGTLAVGVHTTDEGAADLAETLLQSVQPLSSNRF